QLPQPVPARVAFPTAGTVHLPALIAAQIVPLLTPLQSQTWCESGRSASDTSFRADCGVKNSSIRRSGTGASVLNSSIRLSAGPRSPSRQAADSFPSRTIAFQYTRRAGSLNCTTSSDGFRSAIRPMLASSTPITFSLVASFDPVYDRSESVPV